MFDIMLINGYNKRYKIIGVKGIGPKAKRDISEAIAGGTYDKDYATNTLVALDKKGNLYLVNSKEHFIQIVDPKLKTKLKFGNKGVFTQKKIDKTEIQLT